MQLQQLNSETSYVVDPIAPRMSSYGVKLLKQRYSSSSRKRHRFCFHQNPEVDLHDIFICYDKSTYIPPNKHIGKVESLIVLSGALDFYIFNDCGQVCGQWHLSTAQSGHPFYIRVPPNTWHGLRAVGSGPCIIKETIEGPYDRSTLKWGTFAPDESAGFNAGSEWYDQVDKECLNKNIAQPKDEKFERVSEAVFRSSSQLVTVNIEQLQPIIEAAHQTPLKRARLCCHNGPQEKLQEMFIALAQGVNIDESMHLRKDESLTVINGSASYLFPNEDGSVRQIVNLRPFSEEEDLDNHFFARINRYVPHKIFVDSDILLIHEATRGPFNKADTDYRLKGMNK